MAGKIRIGVLSDTHLHRVTGSLRQILEQHLSETDAIFHVGDFTSPSIVEYLSKRPFYGVCGNMDPMEIKNRLPEKRIVEIGAFRFGLVHGWGPSEGLEERVIESFSGVDVVVYGHSHRAVNHIRGGVLVFNPGTACGYSASCFHSVGVLECEESVCGEILQVDLS
ncbi:MAG: metallophosphoesterase family protein [Deltaproteobacteria bacterium]|nr:metallophosphoesterase family protein [Deltaproteobacteria bacterium]